VAGSRRVHNDKGFRPWLAATLCGSVDVKAIHISKDHAMRVGYHPNPSGSFVEREFTEDETLDLFERYREETKK
jgi:hypothetical protein